MKLSSKTTREIHNHMKRHGVDYDTAKVAVVRGYGTAKAERGRGYAARRAEIRAQDDADLAIIRSFLTFRARATAAEKRASFLQAEMKKIAALQAEPPLSQPYRSDGCTGVALGCWQAAEIARRALRGES